MSCVTLMPSIICIKATAGGGVGGWETAVCADMGSAIIWIFLPKESRQIQLRPAPGRGGLWLTLVHRPRAPPADQVVGRHPPRLAVPEADGDDLDVLAVCDDLPILVRIDQLPVLGVEADRGRSRPDDVVDVPRQARRAVAGQR